jgi:CRISPR-associated exonuclease Cas4
VVVDLSDPLLAFLVLLFAVLLFGIATLILVRHLRTRRSMGRLVWTDTDGSRPVLRSVRHRIAGRPDEIRVLRDGRAIPIEIKRRASPRGEVPFSHLIQLWAYCLLIEESTGRSPPYGILHYGDGGEIRARWDASARAELEALRSQMDRPYRGEATPSIARCRHCSWRAGCDRRAI